MTPKEQLIEARNALQAAVDKKLLELPEYKALQDVERAITALETMPNRLRFALKIPSSYGDLAEAALREADRPLTTPQIIEYIAKQRDLSKDPERNKINISSVLSKHENLLSLSWHGGRAWWFKNRPIKPDTMGEKPDA